ncbi:MAG TPA: L-glutamate gamma-semialdehyde dehydrogenase [Catalimonadaceae bacterium]|nr:L-glutamate gamma-semialdehyde dehydrogenase [Catalimonadaceae bacterium]
MNNIIQLPKPINDPVLNYAPGSPERKALKAELARSKAEVRDIPMIIGGQEVRTGNTKTVNPPHEHKHVLAHFHQGDASHVEQAITAALNAKKDWENLSWDQRAAIFLKAADLMAGPYRAKINAATMLGQSKNAYQAEIDSACELIDFLRFNAYFAEQIYTQQSISSPGVWNRMEYRPLEGFVFALTPFNFTAIAGNLPSSPALMGNTVVWKPANTQIYAAQVIMEIFMKAGLPDGVINLVFVDGPTAGSVIFEHPDFAGIHFTGSTGVFQDVWTKIGANIKKYKSYPRIVGETGGKDFVLAHESADVEALAVALIRGDFEYQGQKCSAASRAYIPKGMWPKLSELLKKHLSEITVGSVEDFTNLVNAVIDRKSFDKLKAAIEAARNSPVAEVWAGGKCDDSVGYFIDPTIILCQDPMYTTMQEELFGPVLSIYLYEDAEFERALELVDSTSPYALTGAIFAQNRYAIDLATQALRHSAGNFYVNDKPTGAVVGQQPFGGARASGTNDKAGSVLNLYRWVSPRAIKETWNAPKAVGYPFMEEK